MNKPDPIYFIWVQGFKAHTPVILHGLDQNIDSHGREKTTILQKHELPFEHRDLTVNQLEMIYPYKGI